MSSIVLMTDRISRCIETVLTREDVTEVTKRELRYYVTKDRVIKDDEIPSIPFSCVRNLHKIISSDASPVYLHELLEGTEIYYPPLEQPARNPELVARLKRLKAEQEDKKYREMTQNVNVVTYGKSPLSRIGREVRSFQAQMFGVLNIVLTIGGAFVFGYMAASYSNQPVITRFTIGFAMALIVACADLYFFIKHEV